MGFLLFDRVKRGVRLTAAGQRLLERSQHILGEVDRLKETLQIEAHVPSGPASLAAPPSIGRLLFSRLALTFLKSYPKVQLSLMEGLTSSALGQLRRGELSLAIVTDPPLDPLARVHASVHGIDLSGRPARRPAPEEAQPRGQEPCRSAAGHDQQAQPLPPVDRELRRARRRRLDIRLELESGETLQQLLQSGRIYGLLPYSSIVEEAQSRRLGGVPIRGLAMKRYLAKSRSEANSIARETLEKSVIAEMRELGKRVGTRER